MSQVENFVEGNVIDSGVRVRACVCVCVCESERDRQRDRERERERQRQRQRETERQRQRERGCTAKPGLPVELEFVALWTGALKVPKSLWSLNRLPVSL